MNIRELKLVIREFAALGASSALIQTGKIKPYLKKSEAIKIFGQKKVKQWLRAGVLTPRKDGNHSASWRIDRLEIEIVASAEKISDFFNIE